MSLIETAVKKAKQLGASGIHRQLTPPVHESLPREGAAAPDAEAVAARVAQARKLPVAATDAQVMEQNCVLLEVDDTAAQRAYRILRTRIQQRMQAEGWHSVGVTAAGVGEGKTITSINLAIALARDVNTWVFLVDLDLQRPKIASYLGLQMDKGLSDYLAGNAAFDQIIYNPGVERLTVIPNLRPIERSSDALGSPQMRELCGLLAAEVPRHIVVFDMPPVLLSDDVLKFSSNLDCTLLLASEGETPRAMLQGAREALNDMNVVGVVLNRAAEREESLYY